MTSGTAARTRSRRTRGFRFACLLLVVAAVVSSCANHQSQALSSSTGEPSSAAFSTAASPSGVPGSERRAALDAGVPGTVWPAYGQAAVQVGLSPIQAGPNQQPAPIASVAKVMTAYLVLRDHPLHLSEDGPSITVTDADVADTDQRRRQGESFVPVADGEQLTERQALQALLLPSANNIAATLARWDGGSADRFVVEMNAAAQSMGMTNTHYTDPSGYDDTTVSTAADQMRIVDRAMQLPVFASIVATPTATLPVAGTVLNTDTLLGHGGFVGVKTGSDGAAGGCFAFRALRWIAGEQTTVTGVVLGQPGQNAVAAGLAAAAVIVDGIAGQRATPGLGPRIRPPVRAPGS